MAGPSRARTSMRKAERALERERVKAEKELEALAARTPGGSPENPLDIESPVQIEGLVTSRGCPLCEGSLRIEDHAAETISGERLRVARVRCMSCYSRRAIYFRLRDKPLH